jgi:hypothetical protein
LRSKPLPVPRRQHQTAWRFFEVAQRGAD